MLIYREEISRDRNPPKIQDGHKQPSIGFELPEN